MTEAALIEYLVDHAVYPELPTTPQAVACRRPRADIASLADWLECELDKKTNGQIAWAAVSAIEHVRESLIETLSIFSGVAQSEIQRSLDELHA